MDNINENTSISDLVDALTANESAQFKIYEAYRRAAEKDLDFKDLKEVERIIRYRISAKVSWMGL